MAVSEETVSDVLRLGDRVIPVTVQKVTFRVEEPFESTPGKTVDVYGSGATNDVRFKVGIRYLVYGFRGKTERYERVNARGRLRSAKSLKTSAFCAHSQRVSAVKSWAVCALSVREHKPEP